MAVTGIERNYNAYESAYAAQKNGTAQKNVSEKAEGKESNVNDYSKYLQDKYSYMNTGTTSMQGVPTTISVSSASISNGRA